MRLYDNIAILCCFHIAVSYMMLTHGQWL